eukprot:CAMPEP_0177730772 /NCGR_PEP_ID=MMETSP0484_2-20121128/22174_1 /TAXON_ID=354590 /ORGANISM="Rhodomonas lens, Strain RHODO" /LENGTH=258 /DNA_ID=CAMNT_0019243797 /DNA_START=23 /DNA_END=796 /DNA_ORIENTATION=+
MPVLFVAHGGGPLPIVGGPEQEPYRQQFKALQSFLPANPAAVVVISAHWEEKTVSVVNSEKNTMMYDYGGFPAESYELQYPAPGAPALAEKIRELLAKMNCREVKSRGLDHGVFIPMMLGWPDANIPTLQVSLLRSLDPEEHIGLGRALAPLRDEGVLILGSGLSFHALKPMLAFLRAGHPQQEDKSRAFDDWLVQACTTPEWTSRPAENGGLSKREELLKSWERAPHARFCHPREEHLLPLFVIAGAAGEDNGEVIW